MKTNSPLRLTLAALLLGSVAGNLTGQATDLAIQQVQLLNEAVKLRDEGKLQPALEKVQQVLKANPSDEGAKELVASIRLALDEATKNAAAPAPGAAPAVEVPAIPADPAIQQVRLLSEAIKLRDEGKLQPALEKADGLLKLDPSDEGAKELRASIVLALEEAAKKAPAAPAPAAPIDALAQEYAALYAEVAAAIARAKAEAARGDHAKAVATLDAAIAALPNIVSAQPVRDRASLARQDVLIDRDAVKPASDPLLSGASKEVSAKVAKSQELLKAAESLVRKGDVDSLLAALSELDRAGRELPSNIAADLLKERIKTVRAGALGRLALLSINAREMSRADGYITDLEKLMGEADPSAVRLRAEFKARRSDPTYQNIDELSPGIRQKADRVQELLVRGRARYLYGDYQGAIEVYREVMQYQPNNPEAKAYQVRIRELLSETSGQWNRGVTKGKLLELLDETWKLPEVFNREVTIVGGPQVADPITERIKTIVLPTVRILDQPLDRACQYISQQAQQYDKDQRELNIIPVDPERKNPPISLTMAGVTVEQALNIITRQANFTWIVSQGIIEVRPDSGSSDLETEFFPLAPSAVIKMTGVSGGSAAAPGATASPFAGGGGGSASGAEARPEEIGIKNFFIRSGVAFEGVNGAAMAYDGTNLIVTQNRKNLDRVRNILRRYSDIKQVYIESKFIEVSQSVLNELATNWQIINPANAIRAQSELRTLSGVFGVAATSQAGGIVIPGEAPVPIPNRPPAISGSNFGTGSPTFGGFNPTTQAGNIGLIDSYNLNLFLRAVEQNSGTDLMSSPSLTVLDGKTAIIKVAQLLRYPQSYGDVQAVVSQGGGGAGGGVGGQAVAVTAGTPQDFTVQEVGVTLEVTPTVAADDSIAMNLKPKVIEFEGFVEYGGTSVAISGSTTVSVPSGFFQPIFTTREVVTDVTVFDGATVVIGGLTREEVKTVEDKVPVLGDIPLIGAAFRSSGKSTSKRNLMVFVTANLVSPGGATLRSSHSGMRAGSTFSNPVLASPGGAVYREPVEPAAPAAPTAPTAPAAPVAN